MNYDVRVDGDAQYTVSAAETVQIGGNYDQLTNKPQINGVTLQGNLALEDIGVTDAIKSAIDELWPLIMDYVDKSKRSDIPAGWKRITAIQGNDGAYIDAGVSLNGALTLHITASIPAGQKFSALMVSHNSGDAETGRQGFMAFQTASHKIDYFWPGLSYSTLSVPSAIDFSAPFSVTQTAEQIKITQGIREATAQYHGNTNENTAHIKILHSDNPNHSSYDAGIVYGVDITEGETVIRQFVPVANEKTGECAMYDLAENKLYYNAGEGFFSAVQ